MAGPSGSELLAHASGPEGLLAIDAAQALKQATIRLNSVIHYGAPVGYRYLTEGNTLPPPFRASARRCLLCG